MIVPAEEAAQLAGECIASGRGFLALPGKHPDEVCIVCLDGPLLADALRVRAMAFVQERLKANGAYPEECEALTREVLGLTATESTEAFDPDHYYTGGS